MRKTFSCHLYVIIHADDYGTHLPVWLESTCRMFGCIDQSYATSLKKYATLCSYVTPRKVYITVATSWRHVTIPRQEISFSSYSPPREIISRGSAHSIFNSYVNLCCYLTDIETTFCTLRIDKHTWNNRSDKDLIKILIHTSRLN